MTTKRFTCLNVHARYSFDVRGVEGSVVVEGLVLTLVNIDNGYANDMVRVDLSVRFDGVLDYRLTIPEQDAGAKAIQAGQLAEKVGAALKRIFGADSRSAQRERASVVFTAMVLETVTTAGFTPKVNILSHTTDAVSGADRFSSAVDALFEDHVVIEDYLFRREAAQRQSVA